jgi:hypothetical protein
MSPEVLQAMGWVFCSIGLALHARRYRRPIVVTTVPPPSLSIELKDPRSVMAHVEYDERYGHVAMAEALTNLAAQCVEQARATDHSAG